MAVIRLPSGKNRLLPYEMRAARPLPQRAQGPFNRVALAAAHVVADPLAEADPWLDTRLDWDATLAYRRHLWGLGLGVAEAMDTAQRGMGLDRASAVALDIIAANAAKIDGVKISLLDKAREIALRRGLSKGVRMYTGDDFNYAELIAGDAQGHSDALLGIFDAIAPAASAALAHLAAGSGAAFNEVLAPTVPLSRHIFKTPTRFYKTGIIFMAYLNGPQDHFS